MLLLSTKLKTNLIISQKLTWAMMKRENEKGIGGTTQKMGYG
jgi:hypothetical protein